MHPWLTLGDNCESPGTAETQHTRGQRSSGLHQHPTPGGQEMGTVAP